MRHVVILLAGLVLAGCVSTPRPFEHDISDDQAFRPKDDKVDVAIGPPANMPSEMADRVAAALAVELQAYGIVAAVQPAKAPLKVAGAMSTHDAESGPGIEIEMEWFLFDGRRMAGPAVSTTRATGEDYAAASDGLVSRIAQRAAPQIATLMGKPPNYEARSLGQVATGGTIRPTPPPDAAAPGATPAAATPGQPPPRQVKVMVAEITGAPSDGNRQLFSGMRRALGSNKVVVMDKGGADTFTVQASVKLEPVNESTTQLSLTWILKDPAGKEVGKVEQSNPVPAAATRGSWAGFGDIVAAAAVDGILELLEKALAARPK
ncbi:MAG TPA: hypothetical protein VMI56_28085 [Reyranella sp.]|nr:hypothetical protein [Reyranella sp.]